jgi:hypothetical protein
MLALAGACLFGAQSQGPDAWGSREDGFEGDVLGAALTYRGMFQLARDGGFQDEFGDHVLALAPLEGEELVITLKLVAKGRIS